MMLPGFKMLLRDENGEVRDSLRLYSYIFCVVFLCALGERVYKTSYAFPMLSCSLFFKSTWGILEDEWFGGF